MKIKLIRQFKNHPTGTELDVSKRIYDHLLGLKCIAKPEKPESKSRKRSPGQTRAIESPPADRMVEKEDTEKK